MSEPPTAPSHAHRPAERTALTALISDGVLDAELAALVWLLAESGVPLVVAARDARAAETLRGAIEGLLPSERRTAEVTLAGGVVLGESLEEVVRLHGGRPGEDVPDAARDLGMVVVLREGRVHAAHYVRPVERDGAGHLQRRPPALLSAWDGSAGRFDHFYWAASDELAIRAGTTRAAFEDAHRLRTLLLAELSASGVRDAALLRRQVARTGLATPALLSGDRPPH